MQKGNRASEAARAWGHRLPHKHAIDENDSEDYESYSYEFSSQMHMKPETRDRSPSRRISGSAQYSSHPQEGSMKIEDKPQIYKFGSATGEEFKPGKRDYRPIIDEETTHAEKVTMSESVIEQNKAAIKIQATFRGYRTRKKFWKMREKARREKDMELFSHETITTTKEFVTPQKAEVPPAKVTEDGGQTGTPSNIDPHLGKLRPMGKIDSKEKESLLKQCRNYVDPNLPAVSDLQDEHSSVVLLTGGINPREDQGYNLLGCAMYVYNIEKNKWYFGGTMQEPRSYHGAVLCNGKIYIVGGLCPCTISNGEMVATRTVFQLSLRGKRWRQRADMHQCRAYHGTCVLHNSIVVVGGKDEEGRLLSTVEIYDTMQDKWTFMKPLPKPMMAMAVSILDGVIYVIGGLIQDDGRHELSSTVLMYDIRNPGWHVKSHLPEPLAFCSAATVQREIWLWGGTKRKLSPDGFLTSSSAVYVMKNISDAKWEVCTERLPTAKHAIAVTKTMGHMIFILGGMSSETGEALVENDIFERETVKITDGAPLPHALTGSAAVGLPPDQSSKLLLKWAGDKAPEDVQDLAATKIQAHFRGHRARSILEKHRGMPVYSSTLDSLDGQTYEHQRYSRQSVRLTTSSRIGDDFRKFKTVTINEWPPTIDPTSSKSEVNVALGTHPPGYTVGEKNRRAQIKRYIPIRNHCDPNLGTVQNIEDFFKRTRQSVGLRKLEPTPYSHLEVKGDNTVQDDCIPIILLIGGLNVKDPTNYAFGRSVLKYNPLKDRWQYVGVMPEPRNHHAAAYLDGTVYVTGGLDPDLRNSGDMVATRTVYAMTVTIVEWVRKSSMICTRAFHSLVPYKGKLYAIGGRDNNGRLVASIECYDPKADTWTLMRPMTIPRMGMACVVFENRIWCLGGVGVVNIGRERKKGTDIVATVSSYEPSSNCWLSRPPLRCPRAFASCVTVNKKMWLCAGCSKLKEQEMLISMASIDCYDATEAIWERCTLISNPRHCAATATVEDCIYLFGGISSQEWSALAHNEMIITTDHSIHNCTDLAHSLTGAAAVTIPPYSPSLRAASLSCLLHYNLAR